MKSGSMGKWKLVGAGVVFAGIGLFGALDSIAKSGWRKAEAQVSAVSISCHMRAEEHHVGYKTISEADIPCEAVDAFKALHADKTWSSREIIDGTLSVPGLNGEAVSAKMELARIEGRLPQVGDKLVVIQDPEDPAKVARTDSAQTAALIFVIMGGIGAVLFWFAFGLKRRPKSGFEVEADLGAADRMKKADAMIAAAMTQNAAGQNSAPKGKAQPAMATPARSQPAMVTPGAARSSFGRKR